MKDYFHILTQDEELSLSGGPKCYVDPDDPKIRLYSFEPQHVSNTFAASAAYREVLTTVLRLGKKSVYLIIDHIDWSKPFVWLAGEKKHPAIVRHVFNKKCFPDRE